MAAMKSQGFSERAGGILNGADKALLIFTGGVLIFLTMMIVVDVALRVLFNWPLPASVESTELMMPYITFCALSYTLFTGGHIRIELAIERLPPKFRKLCLTFSYLLGFLFCCLMTIWGWNFFWDSFSINEEMLAVIKLPWWSGKFALPLGFFLMTLRFLLNLFQVLSGRLQR
jgi:TRAP-type C4-dicarboxylate transport system permease small subunit